MSIQDLPVLNGQPRGFHPCCRVNDKLTIVASKTFTTRQGTFTDARETVIFRKVA